MNKKKSFTLIEIMVSFAILISALTGIFLILNTSETFSPINLGRADVAAKARIVMDRIVKDLRGAVVANIANNNPSGSYLKFYKMEGVDLSDVSNDYILSSDDYIEYSYNSNTNTLSRSEFKDGSLNTVEYGNITGSDITGNFTENIFFGISEDPITKDEVIEPLTGGLLSAENIIVIDINLEEQAGAADNVGFSLTQRVKIRNE